jgi:putative intracellular protease/amidase
MGKHIAFLVIDQFADWEPAYLSSAVRTYFDGTTSFHTPGGEPVTSMGGMSLSPDGAVEDLDPARYDALVVVGSGVWIGDEAPDVSGVLQAADKAGKVVGAICAGTLAAGRAGLLEGRPHTSNETGFLDENAKGYAAAAAYVDTPRAVRDGNLVTSAGSSPVTFTTAVLTALHPQAAENLKQFEAMCAAEFAPQ